MNTRAAIAWKAGKPRAVGESDLVLPLRGEVLAENGTTGIGAVDLPAKVRLDKGVLAFGLDGVALGMVRDARLGAADTPAAFAAAKITDGDMIGGDDPVARSPRPARIHESFDLTRGESIHSVVVH